jgi:hypothetical protein
MTMMLNVGIVALVLSPMTGVSGLASFSASNKQPYMLYSSTTDDSRRRFFSSSSARHSPYSSFARPHSSSTWTSLQQTPSDDPQQQQEDAVQVVVSEIGSSSPPTATTPEKPAISVNVPKVTLQKEDDQGELTSSPPPPYPIDLPSPVLLGTAIFLAIAGTGMYYINIIFVICCFFANALIVDIVVVLAFLCLFVFSSPKLRFPVSSIPRGWYREQ